MSLNNMTPKEAASFKGKIEKKWISYRENHLKNLQIQKGATNFAPQTLEMIEELNQLPHSTGNRDWKELLNTSQG